MPAKALRAPLRASSPQGCPHPRPHPYREGGMLVAPPSAARMEIIVDAACGGAGDAGDFLEIVERGGADGAGGAKMHQQGALAAGADAGDVVERTRGHALGAL